MPLSLNKCSRPAPRTLGQQKKRLRAAETRPRGTGPDSNASKQTNRFLPGAAPGLRGAACSPPNRTRRLPEWTRIAASQNHLEWASQAADRQRQYHSPLILGRRGPRSSPVPPSCAPEPLQPRFAFNFNFPFPSSCQLCGCSRFLLFFAISNHPSPLSLSVPLHARTVRRLEDSGGVQILHPTSVQFKLYQREVLRRYLYQKLGGIHPVPTKVCTRYWVQST